MHASRQTSQDTIINCCVKYYVLRIRFDAIWASLPALRNRQFGLVCRLYTIGYDHRFGHLAPPLLLLEEGVGGHSCQVENQKTKVENQKAKVENQKTKESLYKIELIRIKD